MGRIFLTSDLHFCHNREFVYSPRGFNSIYEMNTALVELWNETVQPEDDIYVLGDLMLNDNDEGIRLIKSLKGKIHIILGNHDTDTRVELYKSCYNVVEVCYATVIKYRGYHFYLSHYPTMTANFEEESLKKCMINMFGHTHSKKKFYKLPFMTNDIPFMYNVACDAHHCIPVLLDEAIQDMENKVKECIDML